MLGTLCTVAPQGAALPSYRQPVHCKGFVSVIFWVEGAQEDYTAAVRGS